MVRDVARAVAVLALTAATLLGVLSTAVARASEGTITGASKASCEPGPCEPPSELQSFTLTEVPNDDGTTATREYQVYRPQNLVGQAPAVLVFYGDNTCGPHPASRFSELAPTNRFMVVYMEIPCGRDNVWDKRNTEVPTTAVPDDEPYVTAVVDDITRCPGECADPRRLYAVGVSGGGSMVADVMCDVQNSPLFRGYLIDSSSLPLFEGAPHCPSPNRSFFAMLALGDTGLDSDIYHDTAPNPHLDVPEFAEWAADRLGCRSPVELRALGSPFASTLAFSYNGPCAYASAGSTAVSALGVVNGAHGWACQDSDLGATPNECPTMPSPPGLDAIGLPQTNGLFVEGQFWSFVAAGVSSAAPAAPLVETVPPSLTITAPGEAASVSGTVSISVHASDDTSVASVEIQLDGKDLGLAAPSGQAGTYSLSWDTPAVPDGTHRLSALASDAAGNLTIVSISIVVSNAGGKPGGGSGHGTDPLAQPLVPSLLTAIPVERPRWLALGDDFAAGASGLPTRSSRRSCHRSRGAYPVLAAARLGLPAPVVRACADARIASFYRADGRVGQPSQLSWLTSATSTVSVSVGWNDAGLFDAIARCGKQTTRCGAGWSPSTEAAISLLGPSSRRGRALRDLFKRIGARASEVLVVGYPQPFPRGRVAACRVGSSLSFDRRAMRWVDGAVGRLDDSIRAAASATHTLYVNAYGAFAGHELCSAAPSMNAAFLPDRRGQLALGALLARALGSS